MCKDNEICFACNEQPMASSFGLCADCEAELDAYIEGNPIRYQPEREYDDFDLISCEEIYPDPVA